MINKDTSVKTDSKPAHFKEIKQIIGWVEPKVSRVTRGLVTRDTFLLCFYIRFFRSLPELIEYFLKHLTNVVIVDKCCENPFLI